MKKPTNQSGEFSATGSFWNNRQRDTVPPKAGQPFKLNQTVYYANLRMKENGDVIKCEVRELVIIRIDPPCGHRPTRYFAANAETRYPSPYKAAALHHQSGEALATLKNKLHARIEKLHAALSKLQPFGP